MSREEYFQHFLPFEASGEFSLDSQSMEISLEAATAYGLVTVKDQYVEKASLSDGDHETNLMEHGDGKYWYLYVNAGSDATLIIMESFQGSTISRELNIEAYRHYNFLLKVNEDSASITGLILAPFELEEEEILLGSGSVFFEENGTIKCPTASPGDKGMVGDKMYEAVDRALLIQRRNENADLSCVCTSLVTDMSRMFENREFDQPIGNWDVSNVTDMNGMFSYTNFFNQPIGDWDVSKVTNMEEMFEGAHDFNQPIGNWDVGNVTDMNGMFYQTYSFNQPIGNWDVGNVTDMSRMFSRGMSSRRNSFNHPIGDWDVSNVMNMDEMFYRALNFNQNLSSWCVQNFPSEPTNFSTESALTDANKPLWGNCPE
ncbi:MAG: BspA family leucine-rich repeat surface protein [Cyclobacteriaceae bacterium]